MGAPTLARPRTREEPTPGNGRTGPVPVRRALNVPWILLGVLLVAGSALAFTVLGTGAGHRVRALALAVDVGAGAVLTDDVLTTVEVDAPDGTGLVPASRLDDVRGRTAVADLPAGTLVTGALFTDGPTLEPGEALVGVRLDPSAVPVTGLGPGDPVMAVRTPGTGDAGDGGTPLVWTGTVFAVAPVASPTGDVTVVTLRVDARDAPAVAAAAATDRVRLVLVRSLDDVPPELLFSDLVHPAGP